MPTYRYRCGTCGDELEVWQSINDDALTEHDGCGGGLVKVLSPAGIVLKGSGFYKTDSRTSSKGNGAGTSKPGDSKSGESKPAESKPGTGGSSKGEGSSGSGSSASGAKQPTSSPSGSSGSGTTGGSTS
jgi:putative FmdB family regulatory protein